jgi:hypothetical protein
VNSTRLVKYGTLVSELTLEGEATARPGSHVVYFIGDVPCDADGSELTNILSERREINLGSGLIATCSFSQKPPEGYADYFDKMSTYANMIGAFARLLDPAFTTTSTPIPIRDDVDSPFRYFDSATSRAMIGAAVEKLKVAKVAIIGVGGTGSYVLDLLAKVPISEIHLLTGTGSSLTMLFESLELYHSPNSR